MKKIQLTQGRYALVDDKDFKLLNQHKWYFSHYGYAARSIRSPQGGIIWMHRSVVGAKRKEEVDHINHNKLDNRKINLRACSPTENRRNLRARNNNTSGFKGVHILHGKYIASGICVNRKKIHLGYFKTLKDAALAYNKAAVKYHGNFALLNNI